MKSLPRFLFGRGLGVLTIWPRYAAEGAPGQLGTSLFGDIPEGDDADKPFLPVHDRKTANLLFGHVLGHMFDVFVLKHVAYFLRHDLADLGPCRVLSFGDEPQRHVSVRYHSDQAVAFADRKRAGILLSHQACHLLDAVIGAGDPNVTFHDVSDPS